MSFWAWGFNNVVRGAQFPAGGIIDSLFANGEQGWWYDVDDLSTLWQDTEATIPVTAVGQIVARIDDKSGNGNHRVQPNAGFQPKLQLDATTGHHYLDYDGVDDRMYTAAPIDLSAATAVSVFSSIYESATIQGYFCELGTNASVVNGTFNHIATPLHNPDRFSTVFRGTSVVSRVATGIAAPTALAVDVVADMVGDSVDLATNGITATAVSGTTLAGTTFSSQVLYVGARSTGSSPFHGREYSFVGVSRVVSAEERLAVRYIMAGLSGATLQ